MSIELYLRRQCNGDISCSLNSEGTSTWYHCSASDTNDIAVPFTRFRDKGTSHGSYNIKRRHYLNITLRVNDGCGGSRECNVSEALKRFYSEFHEMIKQNLLG